jgi:hypothetical protein
MALQALAEIRRFDAALEYRNMSDLLRDFRKYLERDAGAPIQRIETNAALILNDFVQFLGLGAQQREKVLGKSAVAFVDALLDERIDLAQ